MKGIVWFLAICFGLAWANWELVIRAGISVQSMQFQLYALPGAFAPAIAAIIVRKWITREGFADAGLAVRAASWPYYLFAWLLPWVLVAAIILEAIGFGIAQPDFTLVRASAAHTGSISGLSHTNSIIVLQVTLVAILMTPVLWGEEFGWRGYLQLRLFAGRPVAAAVSTGLIWGIWHYPVTLRGYNYPEHPLTGSLVFTAVTVLLAYIFGWFRARSGSIWASSLAHSATNSIAGLLLLWFAGSGDSLLISFGGLLAIPPLLLLCLFLILSERRNGA